MSTLFTCLVCDLRACLPSDVEWRGLDCTSQPAKTSPAQIIQANSDVMFILIGICGALIFTCCICIGMTRLCYIRNFRFTRYWNNVCQPVMDDCCCCGRPRPPPAPIEMDYRIERAGILINQTCYDVGRRAAAADYTLLVGDSQHALAQSSRRNTFSTIYTPPSVLSILVFCGLDLN